MRQCLNGNGVDTTAVVASYLAGTVSPLIRHLYLIGDIGDPNSILLTDHEAPVIYNPYGTFQPARISRGSVACKVGLEVQKTTVTWTPGDLQSGTSSFTATIGTASPLQLARIHYFDNWMVRIFKVFMPTPGDANTLGGCEWFGGRIGEVTVGRNQIEFNVASFLDVVTQKVPANVIESTSTLAGYTAATIPPGDSSTPTFEVFTGSTTTFVIADCLGPSAGKIYSGDLFVAGYLVFLAGVGATLPGVWSAIGENGAFTDGNGNKHSQFGLYTALPWAPTPGVDTFYVSKAAPVNIADGDFYGFPFVPNPATGTT